MWRLLLAFSLLAAPVSAQVHATAYEAMRTVGVQLNREYVNHVISVTGTEGNPQPETWKILIDDAKARGGVREIEVDEGRISSERTPLRSSVEGSLGKTIDTGKLNLDSSGAFTLAQQTAQKSHISFARADYTLRSDDRGNPIWIIALTQQNGEAAGRIFIGAHRGTVVRTEGLFVGSDQAAVGEQNRKVEDDDDGAANPVERTFRQVSKDVKRTFNNVSRSFVDFWKDK